jgi:parallel beta-helix repeat protein
MHRILGPVLAAMLAAATLLAVSGGQALANHVQCGDVITQDTTLDSDLMDCPGDGIVIGADNITLDLHGHVIDGDGTQSDPEDANDDGVDNTAGYDHVTVTNGTVQEFDYGVRLVAFGSAGSATANQLHELTVQRNNVTGIELFNSPRNVIDQNSFVENGFGISLYYGSDDNLVEKNTLLRNWVAITIERATQNRVYRNSSASTGLVGIGLFAAHHNRIEMNSAFGARYTDSIGRHLGRGILLLGSDNNAVTANAVSENDFGILLDDGSDGNEIIRNVARTNDQDGIRITSSFGINPGPSDNNRVSENRTSANGVDGVRVDEGNAGTSVESNRTDGNGDDGIDVDDARSTLVRNVANQNGDLGIEAVPDVIDGGGNRAKHNGNPLQCLNVACETNGPKK